MTKEANKHTTTAKRKPSKEPLRIPLDFEQTLADMLKVKPPPDKKPTAVKKKEKDKKR